MSKSYVIGHRDQIGSYKLLTESITGAVAHPLRTIQGFHKEKEVFWAVKDVSFQVNTGEVIGLIGKNGAGKSTILKVISQITYPTRGEIAIRGRVGSLLEVGTGFHPELSGRENIYMNGAILGMKRSEIDRNFEEIVKFSELEKFLDTPVKRYSSGMYVRLGFAVAAHLTPEILLVDEVLAVGDAQFQRKCLGKIKDVSQGGRTVLFVSHNMPVVEGLCDKAILIDDGMVKAMGDSSEVVSEYLKVLNLYRGSDLCDTNIRRHGNGQVRFTWIEVTSPEGDRLASAMEGEAFRINLRLKAESSSEIKGISVVFTDRLGREILRTSFNDPSTPMVLDRGEHRLSVVIDPNPFVRGDMTIKLSCWGSGHKDYDIIEYAYNLSIVPNIDLEEASGTKKGIIHIPFEWVLDRRA